VTMKRLGSCITWSGKSLLTFQGNVLPPVEEQGKQACALLVLRSSIPAYFHTNFFFMFGYSACCLLRLLFGLEDRGGTVLRNFGKFVPVYTT
jgi:hypothetical protein